MTISLNKSSSNQVFFAGENKNKENTKTVKMRPIYNEFAKKTAISAATGAAIGGVVGALGGPVTAVYGANLGAGITAIPDAIDRSKKGLPQDKSMRNTIIMGGWGVFGSLGCIGAAIFPELIKNSVKFNKQYAKSNPIGSFFQSKQINKFIENSSNGKIRAFYTTMAVLTPIAMIGSGAINSSLLKGAKALLGIGKDD